MRIYLAGPSAEIKRVKEAAAAIEARGHTVIGRWWEHVEAMRDAGFATDADVPLAELRAGLDANRYAIRACGAVIALCRLDGGLSVGTADEMGYAAGLNDGLPWRRPVIVAGAPRHVCAAYTTVVSNITEALDALGSR